MILAVEAARRRRGRSARNARASSCWGASAIQGVNPAIYRWRQIGTALPRTASSATRALQARTRASGCSRRSLPNARPRRCATRALVGSDLTSQAHDGHPAAIRPSSAFTTVDLDRPGKQVGFLMIPHSPHDDAWGVTRSSRSPSSRTAAARRSIIEGGNHGDEYEGPITICELIRELDPGEVQGRLILMPANNVHAVMAGRRTLAGRRAQLQPRPFRAIPAARSRSRSRPCRATTSSRIGRCLPRPPFRRLVPRHPAERDHRADRRSGPAAQEHRGRAGLRRAADGRHRQSRRTAHRHGRGVPGRARHRRHRDGGRRHGVASTRSASAGAASATCSPISAC